MKYKDVDFKNSHFLKLHVKAQVDRWHKRRKQAEREEEAPLIVLVIGLVALAVLMYLDPLAFRFVFQGY